MVQNNLSAETLQQKADELSFPKSVVEYMQGHIGQPPYGFPEPLRSKVLRGQQSMSGRPGAELAPLDMDKLKKELEQKHGRQLRDVDVMSAALYRSVFDEFEQFRQTYGPVDKLSSRAFLVGLSNGENVEFELKKGKTLNIQMLADGELTAEGQREVFFELSGQLRSVFVKGNEATKHVMEHPKASEHVKGQVGAPMPGEILEIKVKEGDKVKPKTPLAVLSAMKMEMVIESLATPKMKCKAADLLVEIE